MPATSKNYLAEREIRELNRLTTILLDIFEDQMDIGRLTLMSDAATLLDAQLSNLGRAVLRSGGSVSMAEAIQHVEREYATFKAAQKRLRHERADRDIAEIKAAQKKLGKRRD
ncbi:RhuM family protein [Sphingopyxis sp. PET50]|uniref:RhuM family protein n=1 Tax=Sphingopyxis sp. PET50 TaxID=2976533 RepID=UPI00391A981D